MEPEIAKGYLAAIIDGEGCVKYLGTGHKAHRIVVIHNTEPSIIEASSEACDALGISYRVYIEKRQTINHKDVFRLAIMGRENFERLLEVPIRSEKKKERLENLVKSYKEIKNGKRQG